MATLHFRIDPVWLTDHIRNLWAEGSFDHCLKTIQSAFLDMCLEMRYDLIRGKKKLVQDKWDEHSMLIVSDEWTPDKDRCAFGRYPDPEYLAGMAETAAEFQELHFKNNVSYAMNLLCEIESCSDGLELKDLHERLSKFSSEELTEAKRGFAQIKGSIEIKDNNRRFETKRSLSEKMQPFAGYNSLEEMNLAFAFHRNTPTPEEMAAAEHSRIEREQNGKPKPDASLAAELGWITPNGKFYACLTKMEHVWLAWQFGFTEAAAELKGWIKITKDFVGVTHIHKGQVEPSQKQINTLFEWCEKHKKKLPEWAGGKD